MDEAPRKARKRVTIRAGQPRLAERVAGRYRDRWGTMTRGNQRRAEMAKGMNKRKEVKKPKKETAKAGAAPAVSKNAVQTTTSKIKE